MNKEFQVSSLKFQGAGTGVPALETSNLKLATPQRRPYRPVLVSPDVAMVQLGCDAAALYEMADGDLRWVWNISERPDGAARNLRFWMGELKDRSLRDMDPAQAIEAVAGHPFERTLSRRTVGHLLLLRPPSVLALVRGGQLVRPTGGNRSQVTRASLVDFLHRRLLERMN